MIQYTTQETKINEQTLVWTSDYFGFWKGFFLPKDNNSYILICVSFIFSNMTIIHDITRSLYYFYHAATLDSLAGLK